MLTDDGAFAVMCRMLGLEEITDIISMPDATIREKCGEGEEASKLADGLIKLKRETQRQLIVALLGSEAGASRAASEAGAAGAATSGTDDIEDIYNRMNRAPAKYSANGTRQW